MKKLYRSRTDQHLGGVAGGLAEYLGVDVTLIRLLLVFAVLVKSQFLFVYILAWAIIPLEPGQITPAEPADTPVEGEGTPSPAPSGGNRTSRIIFGYFLVALGAVVLVQRIAPWINFWLPVNLLRRWWPLTIIFLGALLIWSSLRGGGGI